MCALRILGDLNSSCDCDHVDDASEPQLPPLRNQNGNPCLPGLSPTLNDKSPPVGPGIY